MCPVIRVSDETYARLEKCAIGFDTPSNVVERILDHYEGSESPPAIDKSVVKSGARASFGEGKRRYSNKEIQLKISEVARSLPPAELERLCDEAVSKELFGINFPLFIRVPETANQSQRKRAVKTPDEVSRWTWKFQFALDGYSYAICTQWYPKNEVFVSKWLDSSLSPLSDHVLPHIKERESGQPRTKEKHMPRKPYTNDDITLCTFIARFGSSLLTDAKIAKYGGRSAGSVKMKVQNIVAMLDDKGTERCADVAPLSGRPPGESGRETNWLLVEQLIALEKPDHWSRCKKILIGSLQK